MWHDQFDDARFEFEDTAGVQAGAGLDDDLWYSVKGELEPDEDLLWSTRACPPPVPTIAAFPALFTALLCGLSGFGLAVVYGIYGLVTLTPREALLVYGFGP